jgi:hypothetical protein
LAFSGSTVTVAVSVEPRFTVLPAPGAGEMAIVMLSILIMSSFLQENMAMAKIAVKILILTTDFI